ncbi:MAG: Hsp20/alpha crystallin family protein, partial [Okeania sp. SIO3C4]|nr:Hsp20/alpha crystallin family protein [Okeania sp. SIO3C4]
MAIVRFSPWREIDSLQKEMNRVFDNFAPYLNGEDKEIAFKAAAEI